MCWCGCGAGTRPARQSHTLRGYVRGEPVPYFAHHRGRAVTPAQESEACRRYANGENSRVIADDLGMPSGRVIAAAKRGGIPIRPSASERRRSDQEELAICEAYASSRDNAEEIGEAFGCSGSYVRAVVKRHGFRLRPAGAQRKYIVNDGYFSAIDSQPKAYWLGFLAADGSLTGNRLEVKLARKDRDHLFRLRDALGSDYPVRHGLTNKTYPNSRFHVVSPRMARDLAAHGVGPRKSLTHTWPGFLSADLLRHYLRGYGDGDGTWRLSKASRGSAYTGQLHFSFIGTPAFCFQAQRFLEDAACVRKVAPRPVADGKMEVVAYNGTLQVSRIFRLLYDGATVCLPRKRNSVAKHVRSERRAWADTMKERLGDGYMERWRASKNVKLDMDKARTIRDLAAASVPHKEIAGRFGVSINTVRGVIYGKTWREPR